MSASNDLKSALEAITPELTQMRQDMHKNPGLAYDEIFASNLVQDYLKACGVEHETGWGKNTLIAPSRPGKGGTGVVATILGKTNNSGRVIGLRADMDALPIKETTGLPWASQNEGLGHLCGHDGHTAMLLGAAKILSGNPNFDGTVKLIFQPAEEGGRGAQAMIDEELFERHHMDEIYAIHNWPSMSLGTAGVSYGNIMAASNMFDITIKGVGAHGAMPHTGTDALVAAAQIVTNMQTIVSREIDPLKSAVITFGHLSSGRQGAHSVVNGEAFLQGTARAFEAEVNDILEKRIPAIAYDLAKAHGAEASVDYKRCNPATINDKECAQFAEKVLKDIFGAQNVEIVQPSMAAEDFSAYGQERGGTKTPTAYLWLGQGEPENPVSPHNQNLHNDGYGFNDALIPKGVEFFVRTVEDRLPLDEPSM